MLFVAERAEIVSHLLDPELLHQDVRRVAEYGEVRVEQLFLAGKQFFEHHDVDELNPSAIREQSFDFVSCRRLLI